MKSLSEQRDELAQEEYDKSSFKVGFDAASSIWREKLERAVKALDLANYEGDYYDEKPHKAIEVIYSNREAVKELKKFLEGAGE